MKTYAKEIEQDGYTVRIDIHHDEEMGPPWKEHDGHGIVSEWERKPADEATEWVLCEDRGARRFYDFFETFKIAMRDGWGLCDKDKAELKKRLGLKRISRDRVVSEAVRRDFEYLRAWCNDEWSWMGYTTEIETPDGETINGDSCWGFDDEDYMLGEATSNAEFEIERYKLTMRETAIAECVP